MLTVTYIQVFHADFSYLSIYQYDIKKKIK